MTTLDIRSGKVCYTDAIRFSGGSSCAIDMFICIDTQPPTIRFLDENSDGNEYIAVADIDNLILALQKAKELWSKP
jgi:ABC-type lipopolysaccharide export system ATPase subunit